MSEQSQTGNASPDKNEVSNAVSVDDMVHLLKAQREKAQAKPQEKPQSEPEAQEAVEEAPEATETESQEGDGNEVLSKVLNELEGIDLDNISDAHREKLAKLIKSKAVDRFGELTKKARTLEEQLAELKAEKAKEQPLKPSEKDNPFADLTSKEALQAKVDEVDAHIEWAENLLDGNESLSMDDVITVGDKDYTKRQIKDSLKQARKAKDQFLSGQYRSLLEREERKLKRQMIEESTQKELAASFTVPEVKKAYEDLVASANIEAIERVNPEFAVLLPKLLGHAAASIYRPKTSPKKPSLTPSGSPSGSAAPGPTAGQDAMLKELSARYQKSGEASDYVALLAAQRKLREAKAK